jgi:hypothetical protein
MMDWEDTLVAVTLFTVEPTDRALAGWGAFGSEYPWQDLTNAPGSRIMAIVSSYVWS